MRYRLVTRNSKRWDRAVAELLRLHRETSGTLSTAQWPAWHEAEGRLTALEDALDVVLEARRGLHAPGVRQARNGVGIRSDTDPSGADMVAARRLLGPYG